jgi:hypothetical protein
LPFLLLPKNNLRSWPTLVATTNTTAHTCIATSHTALGQALQVGGGSSRDSQRSKSQLVKHQEVSCYEKGSTAVSSTPDLASKSTKISSLLEVEGERRG